MRLTEKNNDPSEAIKLKITSTYNQIIKCDMSYLTNVAVKSTSEQQITIISFCDL